MFLPEKIDVHGLWVRSTVTDGFGRIAYKAAMPQSDGRFIEGYWVVWEPEGSMGKRAVQTSSFHTAEQLIVRPYTPKPWYKTGGENEQQVETKLLEDSAALG